MDENKLKTIVEEVVSKAVAPLAQRFDGIEGRLDGMDGRFDGIEEQLNDPDTGLKRLNESIDANTAAVIGMEAKLDAYGDMYKINDSNIRKMEKRLETVEEKEDIQVPAEFQLVQVADI